MFPSELEIKLQRQQMEAEAAHHRLIQLAQGDGEQPSLWARLRERVAAESASQSLTQSHPTPITA